MTSTWTPVLAASVAVIGTLAAAIFTQVWTARREDKRRDEERSEKMLTNEREDRLRLHQERRAAYVHYLKALHDASEAIRGVSLEKQSPNIAKAQAATAFRNSGIYAAREEVTLLAELDLAIAAREAFLRARSLRDLAARGEGAETQENQAALAHYRTALSNLRAEMRKSLGIPTLGDPAELGPGL